MLPIMKKKVLRDTNLQTLPVRLTSKENKIIKEGRPELGANLALLEIQNEVIKEFRKFGRVVKKLIDARNELKKSAPVISLILKRYALRVMSCWLGDIKFDGDLFLNVPQKKSRIKKQKHGTNK